MRSTRPLRHRRVYYVHRHQGGERRTRPPRGHDSLGGPTREHPLRQRFGVHRRDRPVLHGRAKHRGHLDQSGLPLAEWCRRKSQLKLPENFPTAGYSITTTTSGSP